MTSKFAILVPLNHENGEKFTGVLKNDLDLENAVKWMTKNRKKSPKIVKQLSEPFLCGIVHPDYHKYEELNKQEKKEVIELKKLKQWGVK